MNLRSHVIVTSRILRRLGNFVRRCVLALRPSVLLGHVRIWWAGLHRTFQHFLSNVLLGVAIAVVLHFLHHSGSWDRLHTLEDKAVDWMIDIFSETEARQASMPFIWVDIDEATYSAWASHYTRRAISSRS